MSNGSNQAVGPVCHISPKNVIADPQPKTIPGMPSPPNPASPNFNNEAAAFMQALYNLLNSFLGALNGNAGGRGGSFKVTDLETSTKKIYQNNDPSTGNFVEVKYITRLVQQNPTTGETWTYNKPS